MNGNAAMDAIVTFVELQIIIACGFICNIILAI